MQVHDVGDPEAPAILLLHGAGRDHTMWQPQFPSLSTGHRLLAPDLPGTADGGGHFTLAAASTAIVRSLDERGLARVHVCGLSLGAMVGLHLAATHPGRVASLLLSGVQLRPPRWLTAVQEGVMRVVPWRQLGADSPADKARVIALIHMLRRVDLRPFTDQVRAPTLVVCGARDRLNLRAARQAAHGIPGAALQIVPGAGHVWNEQLPDEFTALISGFVARQSS